MHLHLTPSQHHMCGESTAGGSTSGVGEFAQQLSGAELAPASDEQIRAEWQACLSFGQLVCTQCTACHT